MISLSDSLMHLPVDPVSYPLLSAEAILGCVLGSNHSNCQRRTPTFAPHAPARMRRGLALRCTHVHGPMVQSVRVHNSFRVRTVARECAR